MYGAIIGAGMQLGGSILGANAADRRKKYLEKIAEKPGLDFGGVSTDVVSGNQQALPGAQRFATGVNTGAQADLQSILETAIPGYSPMQRTRAEAVQSMLHGELPSDVVGQVYRHSAAKALEGGYAGSPAGRNLTARDLGLTSLDIVNRGLTGMQGIMGSTPLPRMMQANDILNFTNTQGIGIREQERMKMLELMTGAANSPGSQDVWAKYLTDTGGQMMGSSGGMGGMMGGIGGMMGSI